MVKRRKFCNINLHDNKKKASNGINHQVQDQTIGYGKYPVISGV